MESNLANLLVPNLSFAQSDRVALFDSLAKMLTTEPTMEEIKESQQILHQKEDSMIPFDSPLDQSLGSPASTRDFSSSPFDDYEFDFSNVEDAIMFPDHGTQEMHGTNTLAGLPLFPDYTKQEISFSQQIKEEQVNTSCDFSFDAMTSGATISAPAASPVVASSSSPAPSMMSNVSSESINQLAAVFVREYARSHAGNDTGMLLNALQSAGIQVSNEDVDVANSTLPSPASSQHSGCSQSDFNPVSPMELPAAIPSPVMESIHRPQLVEKTCSSLQSSAKEQLIVDTRYGRRFLCSVCHKQFDRAFNLRTHQMTHIDPEERDRPFFCPWSECSKSFSRKYDAERHYRSVHIKRGEIASKKQVQMALSGRRHDHDTLPSNG